MGNRVVHFEIEAQDMERASKFYSQAFGWEMQKQSAEYGDYIIVKTGEDGTMGINGGIFKGETTKELNAYSCVVGVDDIKKAMADVKAAGGKVLMEPVEIPMVGLFVKCDDTEGNRFTLLQPSMDMMPKA